MAVFRDHPYGQFNFLVALGDGDTDSVDAGFSEVSGLSSELDVIEYRAGNDRTNTPIKVPGLERFGDVTLRRGLIGSLTLWEWITGTGATGRDAVRTVVITLLDEERSAVMSWKLLAARPVRYSTGPLNANGTDIAIEDLVLAHEGLRLE